MRTIGKCFDLFSFECINFQGLSQIIANLTRESLAELEAEIRNLPWTQTEKDNMRWPNADLDSVHGRVKKPTVIV